MKREVFLVVARTTFDDIPLAIVPTLVEAEAIAQQFDPELLNGSHPLRVFLGRLKVAACNAVDVFQFLDGVPHARVFRRDLDYVARPVRA